LTMSGLAERLPEFFYVDYRVRYPLALACYDQ
jgi:hypothetical protein